MAASAQRYVCPDCGGRYRSFRTEVEWFRDHAAGVCPVHFLAAEEEAYPVEPVVVPAAETPSAPFPPAAVPADMATTPPGELRTAASRTPTPASGDHLRRGAEWVITREWYAYLVVGVAGVGAAKAGGPGLLDVMFLLIAVVSLVAAGYRLHDIS